MDFIISTALLPLIPLFARMRDKEEIENMKNYRN